MDQMIENIRSRAAARQKKVVFPEADDPRVLEAASYLVDNDICKVILIAEKKELLQKAADHSISLSDSIEYISPTKGENHSELIDNLYRRRKHKGISREEAANMVANPLYLGAGLVAVGRADAYVAGSVATTGAVIKVALHSIGLKAGTDIVSSTFLMALKDGRVLTYADCGVVPYPDADQLSDIAIESAQTHQLLTGEDPIVAMLSFSTKGSAEHERTKLVTNAMEIAQQKNADLTIDGELQFDAAFVPAVADRKAPDSPVAGKANVFIFPNLDAGNIAYKITERLAGARATGPILQGLAKPMMDLSRGCRWQDIVNAACVAILMGNRE